MGNTHSFNTSLAKQIGLEETLLLQHLYYWHQGNESNPSMNKDGRVWTYQPVSKISKIFEYLTASKIKGALSRLEKGGFILVANYNKMAIDRTKWYSLTDKSLAIFRDQKLKNFTICENDQPFEKLAEQYNKVESNKVESNNNIYSESENLSNDGLAPTLQYQEETPPPVSVAPPTEDLSFDRFWRIYDKKVGKAKAISQFAKLKLSDLTKMFNVLLSFIESRPDKQYRPDPERFLRNRVWEDEIILPNIKQQSNGGISKASSSEIISAPQGYVYDPTSHF